MNIQEMNKRIAKHRGECWHEFDTVFVNGIPLKNQWEVAACLKCGFKPLNDKNVCLVAGKDFNIDYSLIQNAWELLWELPVAVRTTTLQNIGSYYYDTSEKCLEAIMKAYIAYKENTE